MRGKLKTINPHPGPLPERERETAELWHFYAGAALTLYLISSRGRFSQVKLGPDLRKKESYQVLIPRGTWFAAAVAPAKMAVPRARVFTLAGCTVAPGFDFSDFEMAQRNVLLKKYPAHRHWILRWTR